MKLPRQLARSNPALYGFPLSRAVAHQNAAPNRLWKRCFSITRTAASQLPGLDPSKLVITKTSTPQEPTAPKDLVFGKIFTGTPLDSAPAEGDD